MVIQGTFFNIDHVVAVGPVRDAGVDDFTFTITTSAAGKEFTPKFNLLAEATAARDGLVLELSAGPPQK